MSARNDSDEIEIHTRRATNVEDDVNVETRIEEVPDEGATVTETENAQLQLSRTFAPISTYLRVIKWTALFLIGACILVGTVLSKVSLVSITGRMFNLTRFPDGHALPRSVLFIQLTFFLIIPEVVSFIRCLVWGFIGKTTESFPWPSLLALVLVSLAKTLLHNYVGE